MFVNIYFTRSLYFLALEAVSPGCIIIFFFYLMKVIAEQVFKGRLVLEVISVLIVL